ncbi:hypothetical protein Q1W73_09415 [Asticcacaulis sp. ZE23SCel15]|uniref:TPM domain-containing protein n=1 Tax=Asticcacaulis sp. ZE23SCel15 TaxID=3059027 RepID=UPI00265DB2C4|nr:hypothetical protein [Asticcacaulis sp. ZE23SCel15]WKL55922.1 hypothetical protein Q1W73_09415 [Asticcacaulis sp. ZE23SCel15]
MALKIDHSCINAAISKAEETTSGEITCIIKSKPLDYPETPLMWATATALIGPVIMALMGVWPQDWLIHLIPSAAIEWQSAHGQQEFYNRLETIGLYGLVQVILFAIVYGLVTIPKVRLALTPGSIKRKRAHKKAMEQFMARGLHLTKARTGVMIFCALEEHFVDVIADEGIYSKVDHKVWDETVAALISHIKRDDLTGGFEAAVIKSGEVLSAHFPPDAVNLNELPDVLIEI